MLPNDACGCTSKLCSPEKFCLAVVASYTSYTCNEAERVGNSTYVYGRGSARSKKYASFGHSADQNTAVRTRITHTPLHPAVAPARTRVCCAMLRAIERAEATARNETQRVTLLQARFCSVLHKKQKTHPALVLGFFASCDPTPASPRAATQAIGVRAEVLQPLNATCSRSECAENETIVGQ